jgi:PAS domain S-box-containing protein
MHRGSNGEVEWIDGVLEDITEHKRAQEALRGAERLQKAILDNIPDPVWLKDVEGRFLAVNQAFARFYGRPAESVIGETVFECARPEADRLSREDLQVMQERHSVVVEGPLTDAQGRTSWFETVKSPLFNERAEVVGTVGIARDITGRKRAESLLQAQRDLGVSLSLTSDLAGALKYLLDIALRMGGVDSGSIYLFNENTGGMDMVAHHGEAPGFFKAVAHWAPDSAGMQIVRRGQPTFGTFRELPFPQDELRQREGFRAVAILPLSHHRKLIGALCLASHTADEIPVPTRIVIEAIAAQATGAIARIRAETESHRLERQLLEISDREQARIGQDIHDGLCQQLVSLAFDANSLHRDLLAGRRPTEKMAERIARLLDEAITESRQLSRGLFPVRLETEGLPSALEELATVTHARFKIRCRFRNRGAIAVKDRTLATHLYRIAQEAVTNAVKHGQAKAISISLSAQDDQLELRVEDNGRGIQPEASQDRAGMGLHIMDYRARSIGGTVRIARRPRGGTAVFCCVPRQ